MVAKDDALSKEKEIDKLMDLIYLSFKKIYKPTNNLKTSSNTNRANQDNTPRTNRGATYENQRLVNVAGARETIVDLRDDPDDEPEDQELEAHYLYMTKIQEVNLDFTDNSRPIFAAEPLQKADQNDDDLARERDLLASLIDKLKCEIDDSKNHNKLLKSSNKTLVDKLKAHRDNSVHRQLWVLKAHNGSLKLLSNFVEKLLDTVKFRNDRIASILGYGYLVQGNVTIKRVVKKFNHNLFFVGQFCNVDLEVAFQKSTCYICDLKGNYLLIGSCGTYLYSNTLQDISTPNSICLMAKASSSQAWLWHHHLSHLNFDTIKLILKYDIVTGFPKLKFVQDHLCSSYDLGKAKWILHTTMMSNSLLITNSITDEIPYLYIRLPKVEARIIPGPVGILQKGIGTKKADVQAGGRDNILTTQEYVTKVNEDVFEDDYFMQGLWLQAIVYLHGEGVIVSGCLDDMKKHCIKGKLELVVGVFKSYTPNSLGDIIVTLKDPTVTMGCTIHYKVFQNENDGYAKSIKVGSI
nr:hypothetical protein [Tanacetum cinerariifolium]